MSSPHKSPQLRRSSTPGRLVDDGYVNYQKALGLLKSVEEEDRGEKEEQEKEAKIARKDRSTSRSRSPSQTTSRARSRRRHRSPRRRERRRRRRSPSYSYSESDYDEDDYDSYDEESDVTPPPRAKHKKSKETSPPNAQAAQPTAENQNKLTAVPLNNQKENCVKTVENLPPHISYLQKATQGQQDNRIKLIQEQFKEIQQHIPVPKADDSLVIDNKWTSVEKQDKMTIEEAQKMAKLNRPQGLGEDVILRHQYQAITNIIAPTLDLLKQISAHTTEKPLDINNAMVRVKETILIAGQVSNKIWNTTQ